MKKNAITELVPSTPARTRRAQQKLITEVVLTAKKDAVKDRGTRVHTISRRGEYD